MSKLPLVVALLLVGALVVPVALSSRTPSLTAPTDGRLRACSRRPNCVSSQAEDEAQRVAPLALPAEVDPHAAFRRFVELLDLRRDASYVPSEQPATEPKVYAHVVFVTPFLRFRDDVELLLDVEARVVHVRSGSRVGYSDLGANRKRVEALRQVLAEVR